MHGPAAIAELGRRRNFLGEVDGRLRRLELVALGDDLTRLGQLLAKLVDARVGDHRFRNMVAAPGSSQEPVDRGAGDGRAAEKKGQAASHRPDATVSAATCLARRAPVPGHAHPARPHPDQREARGNVIDYEILLLLDPELTEERQNEIVGRTRELVERGGGRFEAHDVWGRRKLAYEIDHKPEGVYHLLTFATQPAELDEVSRVLKITDGVMRHIAVRRPKPSRAPAPASAPPRSDTDREPEYAAPATETERK